MTTRSKARIRAHYDVEKELADRLRNSSREERKTLYPTLYDDLFRRVPDHPRLTTQETEEDVKRAVATRMRILEEFLTPETTFLEIAPGDCNLSLAVCKKVKTVIAADISPQATHMSDQPANFTFLQYDGYDLPIDDASIDVLFSYQFLEHLHPDDVDLHMAEAFRVLKPDGAYVFDTPHRFSGPHDVSRHFGTVARGFHLKEWTYFEMIALLKRHGFSDLTVFHLGKPRPGAAIRLLTTLGERVLQPLPGKFRQWVCRRLYQSVTMIVRK